MHFFSGAHLKNLPLVKTTLIGGYLSTTTKMHASAILKSLPLIGTSGYARSCSYLARAGCAGQASPVQAWLGQPIYFKEIYF